jgi:hypothetical protein
VYLLYLSHTLVKKYLYFSGIGSGIQVLVASSSTVKQAICKPFALRVFVSLPLWQCQAFTDEGTVARTVPAVETEWFDSCPPTRGS